MTPEQELRAKSLELAITAHRYSGLEPTDPRLMDTAYEYAEYLQGRHVRIVASPRVRTQVHALGCARLGGTGFDCTCSREHP